VTTWSAVLAELDANVTTTEQLLTDEFAVPPAESIWTPPAGLPPVPSELRDQALDVLRRLSEVEAAIAVRADVLRRQVAQAPRRDPRQADVRPSTFVAFA
jgi:hypothetical protein